MVYWKRSWPSQDCPELSRYHSHQAEIVTRARYFTERCTKTTSHDRFQHTIMLLTIRAARFMHHVLVLSPELSRYRANDAEIVTRPQTKSWYLSISPKDARTQPAITASSTPSQGDFQKSFLGVFNLRRSLSAPARSGSEKGLVRYY